VAAAAPAVVATPESDAKLAKGRAQAIAGASYYSPTNASTRRNNFIIYMGGSAHLNYTAGGLCVAGGVAGYLRAASMASLLGGIGAGLPLIGAGYLISGGSDFEGHALGCASGSALAGGMGMRFLKSGRFMPAGLVASIGLLAAVYNGKKAMDWAN
jgi:uncharacterized membrane protein (UPF0136 family)